MTTSPSPQHPKAAGTLAPLLVVIALIGFATLVPIGGSAPRINWRLELPDVLVNLALYFPLGYLLAKRGWRHLRVLLIAGAGSGFIELLQATLIAGRRGSPGDVLVNALGAALGAAVQGYSLRLAARGWPARHRAAAAALLSLPALAWLGSGLLLAPDPAASPVWFGQWAHHFADTEPFLGQVLSVRLQDRPLPDGPVSGFPPLRGGGELRFEATVLSGGPTGGPASVASVADPSERRLIGMEQRNQDLTVYWSSHARRLGLRPAMVTFADAARARPGERLLIRAEVSGRRVRLNVAGPAGTREWTRALTPLAGWRSLIPTRELTESEQRLFDLVWALALLGYVLIAGRVLRSFRVEAIPG